MMAGTQRNPAFPDVPCAREVGLPDYNVTTWYGIWAPRGTSADVQVRVADEVRKAMASPDLQDVWAQNGAEFPNLTQAQFATFIDSEVKPFDPNTFLTCMGEAPGYTMGFNAEVRAQSLADAVRFLQRNLPP